MTLLAKITAFRAQFHPFRPSFSSKAYFQRLWLLVLGRVVRFYEQPMSTEAPQASPGNAVRSPTFRPDWWVPLACSSGSRRCHNEKVSLSSVLPRRWWLQAFFIFTPLFGEDSHFDSYFSIGLKPSTRVVFRSFFQLPSTQFGFYRNFHRKAPRKRTKNSSPKRDHEISSSALWITELGM